MRKLLRIVAVLAVLWALGLLPFRGTDVAELLPVKTVIVTHRGNTYTVDVGAGVRALGRTLSEALQALREESTGKVFLPTAEQVILTEGDPVTVAEVTSEEAFRPAAGIYLTPDLNPDPDALGDYLAGHSSNTTLKDVRAALETGESPEIPVVAERDGGYRVYE